MGSLVLGFEEVDRTLVAIVGGKGANLGELSRIEGIHVPPGFCVTTAAYDQAVAGAPLLDAHLDRLAALDSADRDAIATISAEVRRTIEATAVPDDVAAAIATGLDRLGRDAACAVRSSATAEDLPSASFAGQQDTYLNVLGRDAVLDHVRRCWASLFTERAVAYRQRHGYDHRQVRMAVVVQRMAFPQASGIAFTAHPITGDRTVVAVEAGFGLGEALVAGLVNPDTWSVRDGAVVARTVASKPLAIDARPGGGTVERAVDAAQQGQPALTDAQVLHLARLARRIEAHFGAPQDIEWCVVGDDVQVVQSRPITTLFPVPGPADGEHHVYLSVGHQQMMTDPMKPLGRSVWQLLALPVMHEAGGRLFVDATQVLASKANQAGFVAGFRKADPLTGDALQTLVDRPGFLPPPPDPDTAAPPPGAGGPLSTVATDPAIVAGLIEQREEALATLQRDIQGLSGAALLDFVLDDIAVMKQLVFDPQSRPAVMAGMEATWWLNDHLLAWLGETNAADTLTQSVPHNVTSEMGLALLDVADAIRPHPEVVAFLEGVDHDGFLPELDARAGGSEARQAIEGFLDRYGMRCVGEIDITRPRWSERPTTLVPAILANVRNAEPGAAAARFEQGRLEAEAKATDVLRRLRSLPDGEQKAAETEQMIERVRTFAGYREYPKYVIVTRLFVYKQALLGEVDRLVRAGVLRDEDDASFLTIQELHDVVRGGPADPQLVDERRAAHRTHEALTPPRVITSDGEIVAGAYRRDGVPEGALVGLAVSAGTVEGRARVVHDIADADLDPGDILVTAYTDPSWSPLFVAVAGLVTEVGGQMTHGAVIAREYGLPAVVAVERATQVIRDGQRIRIHGTAGYVELLADDIGD